MSLGYWKREGSEPEFVRCRIRAEVHANAGRVDRPSTSCAPLQLSPLPNKLTIRGGDYCLILNNVEKNYRCKSGSRFRGSSLPKSLRYVHHRGSVRSLVRSLGLPQDRLSSPWTG